MTIEKGETPINPHLIVNADDYGHTPGVSAGIRASHLRGIVTSTTAMMNMPGVEEALERAMQECPKLGLGVHLVLTTGSPLLPAQRVRSLVMADGTFPDEGEMIARLASVALEEVEAEWRAQIEKFVAVTGRPPDHLDSHHHISFLSPGVFQLMLELARTHACAIRFPTGQAAEDMMGDFPAELAYARLQGNLRLLQQYQPRHPDRFLKSFYGDDATQAALLDLLADLPGGTTELMCHPGYADEELLRSSTYHRQRENEFSILTGNCVLELVKTRNIKLIHFGDL